MSETEPIDIIKAFEQRHPSPAMTAWRERFENRQQDALDKEIAYLAYFSYQFFELEDNTLTKKMMAEFKRVTTAVKSAYDGGEYDKERWGDGEDSAIHACVKDADFLLGVMEPFVVYHGDEVIEI